MNPLAILHDPKCLKHLAGPAHPERAARLEGIIGRLKSDKLWTRADHPEFAAAVEADLRLCHTDAHIERVKEACTLRRPLEPDTGVCPESWDAALLAAGAAMAAADLVHRGDAQRALVLMRPPGHHAESAKAMGFCLFGNVAIAARHLIRRRNLQRVAVVDFDVHHGNGTQEIFWKDGQVLFCSVHQYGPNPLNPTVPFYPGSGAASETGDGPGRNLTVNAPLPAGSDGKAFLTAIQDEFVPRLEAFKPELLLISAGFDAHKEDPLALCELVPKDFGRLTQALCEAADRICGGKVVSVLEGGYHLDALAASVSAHAAALL